MGDQAESGDCERGTAQRGSRQPTAGVEFQPLSVLVRGEFLAVARRSRLNEIAVSDRVTLRGLTQFLTQSLDARPQTAEDKSICGAARFEGGFCATLLRTVR